MPPLSITRKLVLLFLTAAFVAVIGAVVLVQDQREQQLDTQQRARLEGRAATLALELARDFEDLRRDVRFLGELPPVQGIGRALAHDGSDPLRDTPLATWRQRLSDIFAAFLHSRPSYFQLRLIGVADGGRELVRVERTEDGSIARMSQQALQRKGHRRYFREIASLPGDRVYLSPINLNREHGRVTTAQRPTLRAGLPIRGPEGALFAMVVINQDFGTRLAQLSRLAGSADIYLTNAAGDFLVHPDPARRFGFDLGERHTLVDAFGAADPQAVAQQPQALRVYRPVPFDRGVADAPLALILEHPRQSREVAAVQDADTRVVMLVTVAALFTSLVLLGLIRRLTAPLGQLAVAAQALAAGEYAVALPGSRDTDIAPVTRAFRHMVAQVRRRESQLKTLTAELEDRVQARTQALRASQQHLEAERARLDAIIDSLAEGVMVVGADGQLLRLNRAFQQLVPAPLAGPPETWPEDCGIYDDASADTPLPPAQLPLLRARSGVRSGPRDLFLRCGAQAGRWVAATGRPLLDAGGRLVGAVLTVQDLSERKQAEMNLRLTAGVFEHSLEAMAITDADGRILQVNQAYTDITGYSRNELMGTIPDSLCAEHHGESYSAVMATLSRNGAWQGELCANTRDGRHYALQVSLSTVHDEAGRRRHYIEMFYDITERKALEARITQMAYRDPLTGLANRHLFQDRLRHAMEVRQRQGSHLALLFIDLDRFKQINDELGHDAGDQVLRAVAQRIQASLRAMDTAARLGGDEFAVILEDTDSRAAGAVADKLLAQATATIPLEDGQAVSVGASIGIAGVPENGATLEAVLQHADQAMYQAKAAGGTGYRFGDDPRPARRA